MNPNFGPAAPAFKANDQIRYPQVRLVLQDGTMHGIVKISEALQIAGDSGLDLIEVAGGNPPVCKLVDLGKLKYEESKKAKHNAQEVVIKEVRVKLNTDPHDLEIKHKKIREFLDKKFHVRYVMLLAGREVELDNNAAEKFESHLQQFENVAVHDKLAVFTAGRKKTISTTLRPI